MKLSKATGTIQKLRGLLLNKKERNGKKKKVRNRHKRIKKE